MKRMLTAAVIGLAALTLSGCTAPEQPDDAEVQAWLDAQTAAGTDVTAQLAARAAKQKDLDAASGDQVRVDFGEPTRITSVEFSCFGSEAMRGAVKVITGSSTVGAEIVDDIDCADGPIAIDLEVGDNPVESIIANGFNDQGFGAWAVTVH